MLTARSPPLWRVPDSCRIPSVSRKLTISCISYSEIAPVSTIFTSPWYCNASMNFLKLSWSLPVTINAFSFHASMRSRFLASKFCRRSSTTSSSCLARAASSTSSSYRLMTSGLSTELSISVCTCKERCVSKSWFCMPRVIHLGVCGTFSCAIRSKSTSTSVSGNAALASLMRAMNARSPPNLPRRKKVQ